MKLWPLATACCAILSLTACDPTDDRVDIEGDEWFIVDPGLLEPVVEPEPEPTTPLDGAWSGPDEIGGCIDAATWLDFGPGDAFTYNYLNANQCTDEEARGLFACDGMYSVESDAPDMAHGVMTFGCQSDAMSSASADTRSLVSDYMIVEEEGGGRSLTFKAWRWREDGSLVRERSELLEYPPSAEGFPRERSTSEFTSTMILTRATGAPIASPADLPEMDRDDVLEVTITLTIEAEVFLSFSGARDTGKEEFSLPALITSDGEGRLELSARIEGASDFEAWTDYLRGRGVFVRLGVASSAFTVAFTRTLYFDRANPVGFYAPGAWRSIEDACVFYDARYRDYLEGVCEP